MIFKVHKVERPDGSLSKHLYFPHPVAGSHVRLHFYVWIVVFPLS